MHFPIFEQFDFIRHCYSTRIGGVSNNEFESLNLGFDRGDSDENVLKNYDIICAELGIGKERLVLPRQTHSVNIRIVTQDDIGKGITSERDYDNIDGLITDEKGICLVVYGSDCVPLFFLDPEKKVIGVAHAGWKGTLNNIASEMAKMFVSEYGSDLKKIKVAVGPSICKECYEIGSDVAEQFIEKYPDCIKKGILTPEGEKYKLSLWDMNKYNLVKAGIVPDNIEISGFCTCCNSSLFFSHRKSGGKRGSLAGFFMLV